MFGLKPWELAGGPEHLTFDELAEYHRFLDAYAKAINSAPKRGAR
jgi:hypothetical protein